MNQDVRRQLEDLLSLHERRLYELQKKAARYGIDTPPHVNTEIEDLQKEIEAVKQQVLLSASDNQGSISSDKGTSEQAAMLITLTCLLSSREINQLVVLLLNCPSIATGAHVTLLCSSCRRQL